MLRTGIGHAKANKDQISTASEKAKDSVPLPNVLTTVVETALAEALLGAAAEGGLCDHPQCRKDETIQLDAVEKVIHYAGFKIINADMTVNGISYEGRRLLFGLKDRILQMLFLKQEQVNLKPSMQIASNSTNESEWIECFATVLLDRR